MRHVFERVVLYGCVLVLLLLLVGVRACPLWRECYELLRSIYLILRCVRTTSARAGVNIMFIHAP